MYKNYVFDLYGTLVDIRTNEYKSYLWKKMSEFYGFYEAHYTPAELKKAFHQCIIDEEIMLYEKMKNRAGIKDKSDIEIQMENVFMRLFEQKGVKADKALAIHAGQMFRVISMKFENVYDGVFDFLESLKKAG